MSGVSAIGEVGGNVACFLNKCMDYPDVKAQRTHLDMTSLKNTLLRPKISNQNAVICLEFLNKELKCPCTVSHYTTVTTVLTVLMFVIWVKHSFPSLCKWMPKI